VDLWPAVGPLEDLESIYRYASLNDGDTFREMRR
jgi:hypothetical protein